MFLKPRRTVNRSRVWLIATGCGTAPIRAVSNSTRFYKELLLEMSIRSVYRKLYSTLLIVVLSGACTAALAQTPQLRTITSLRSTADGPAQSCVTITSDGPVNEYASYKSEDRFYIVISATEAASLKSDVSGPGFADPQVQKRGSAAVVSFRLVPGTQVRVEQKSNSLEVYFTTEGGATTKSAAPAPTPTPNSPQQDATRPPGTEQNQPIPESARPTTQDPTAPPGTQRPAPQTPPGTSVTPQTPTTTTLPVTTPSGPTTTATPAPSTTINPATTTGIGQEPGDPSFPSAQPRPVPPLPNLTRLGINSDQTVALSLNEAIRRALENNNDIEVARNDVRLAETTLRSLLGIYDPFINLNPQLSNVIQSQQSTLGGSDQSGNVQTTDLQMNSSLSKRFMRGGGSYDFFFNNNRRTTNSTFNQLNPVYSGNLGVQFTQPLLRNRSIDNDRRQIRIQRKRVQQSDADFRRRTIDVISQVQRAYWDLVFALRDQQNRVDNLNLSRENFRRIEAQIAAGAAAPFGRAEVETELANRESDVLIASQNVSIAENNLKQLLLRDALSPDWSAQIVPTDEPSFDATPINLNDALADARTNRPELARLRLQREINDIDLKYFRNQTKPQIDIVSTLTTTGLSGTPTSVPFETLLISGEPGAQADAFLLNQINVIRTQLGIGPVIPPTVTVPNNVPDRLVGGYGRTLRNLFTFDTRNVVVGLTIQIPLRNRTAEANLAGAQIQRTQLEASTRSQEQVVEVEVRNAAQSVETARRRVLTARAARESAEVQLEGERRLYQVGRSTTFLLIQRENQLTNARNAELRAETDYNKALADLQHATSTTLRANNVIIETPTVP
jgi:outer membrane protein TolC